jgi:hypothetical protein
VAVEGMTRADALKHVEAIKHSADDRRRHILALYEGRGWEALGYDNWRTCVQKEFGKSHQHLYRELAVVPVELEVSPIGEIGTIRESLLRPLLQLDEGRRKDCWDSAKALADDAREKLTAKHVQRAVNHALDKKTFGPKPEELRPSGFSPRVEKVEGDGPRWALRVFKGLAHDLQQLDWLRRNADEVCGKPFPELCDLLKVDTTLVQILLETLGQERDPSSSVVSKHDTCTDLDGQPVPLEDTSS